tara:strand:- start:1085 stop:1606 length:522 start_codon:yes stop_codon:yes gene_type:complete
MAANQTLRHLFDSADSISIDDEFIRYPNPNSDEEFELSIDLDDDRYDFTSKALDVAKMDDDAWSIYCEYNKQYVDVRFFTVTPIKTAVDSASQTLINASSEYFETNRIELSISLYDNVAYLGDPIELFNAWKADINVFPKGIKSKYLCQLTPSQIFAKVSDSFLTLCSEKLSS